MRRTGMMTGSLMALVLLAGGTASAQALHPRLSYPQDQDDLAQTHADEAQDDFSDQAAPPRADDDFSDVVAQDEQDRIAPQPQDERYGRSDEAADAARPDQTDDRHGDELTTSCALAARDEAEQDGGYAEIRQMQAPRETRNGYDVEGDVEIRTGWRAQDGVMRHFTCSVQNDRIVDVYFQRERAAR